MIYSAEMINFVRFSAMIFPSEMTVFYRKSPSKSGNTLLRVKLSFFYDKENDYLFVMARGKSPYRNERKESHPEKLCRHIEMRRTNPPPIHNQSICFHLKMTVILRPPK